MNTPADAQKTAPKPPLPKLDHLTRAIGHSRRWRMLRELSSGEPRMVAELARAAGCSRDMASKHVAILRKAGLVVQGRGRLYTIPAHHLPTPGVAEVDFGHCVLRLDKEE
jgi:biotin operon repressor